MLPEGSFVPNDCRLDPDAEQLVLITGPNMAGKSTYMRQVAQIVAARADRRVRAGPRRDDRRVRSRVHPRRRGRQPVARRLDVHGRDARDRGDPRATRRGARSSCSTRSAAARRRSTASSIAWAVAEHLHDAIGARTLFATHYHELVALADSAAARAQRLGRGARAQGRDRVPAPGRAGRREPQLRHRRRAPRRACPRR